jgi:hypothetical protein
VPNTRQLSLLLLTLLLLLPGVAVMARMGPGQPARKRCTLGRDQSTPADSKQAGASMLLLSAVYCEASAHLALEV